MSYKALALQLTCQTINPYQTQEESESAMLQTIERIEKQIAASINLIGRDRTSLISMRARRKQAAWNDDYMLSLLVG